MAGPAGLALVAAVVPQVALAEADAPQVVIVRAERLADTSPVPGTVVLDAVTLEQAPQQRLDGIIRAASGAGLFRRTGSAVANATIQGLGLRPLAPTGAGRAEVRLDGVPQNDPFGGWVAWGRLDPLFLDAVRLDRGGAGAGAGPLALTGAVDLVEARGGASAARLWAGDGGSRGAAARWSVEPGGAGGDGTLVLMGVHDRSDGVIPVAPRWRGPVDRPAGFELTALTATATVGRDPADGGGIVAARLSGFADRKGAGLAGGGSSTRGADASLAWRRSAGQLEGRVILYGQQRRLANRTATAGPGRGTVSFANDQFDTPASAVGLTGQLRLAALPGAPVLEADLRRADGETRERFRFLTDVPTRQRQAGGRQLWAGLAARIDPVPLGSTGLTAGGAVRLDHWAHSRGVRIETDLATGMAVLSERPADRDGIEPGGRMTLAAPALGLATHLYRTIRLPSLNELHRPFRVGNDLTEANAGLAPERLAGVDLVWQGRPGGVGLEAVVWSARLEGPVTNVTLGAGPGVFPRAGFLPAGGAYRERRNAGTITAGGVELRGRREGRTVTVTGFWNLTRARVDGGSQLPALTGLRPAQAPEWTAGLDLSWRPQPDGPWRAGLAVRAESDRFEDDLNSRRLDGFVATDVTLARRVGPVELVLVAENLTGAQVQTALAGDGTLSLAGGRTARLELRWQP